MPHMHGAKPLSTKVGAARWCAALILVALPATVSASTPLDWTGLPWPPDGDLTNTTALSRLIALPTAPGNACADYTKLTALEGDPLPYPHLGVVLETRLEGSAADKAKLKKLAADPAILKRLSAFREGARKGTCRTAGATDPWPPLSNPLVWKIASFRPVLQHIAVAEQHAWDLAERGKLDEAVAWLEALVIVGWHLQQDVVLISNLIGIKIGTHAAESLSLLLKAKGGKALKRRSKRWWAYAGLTQWRRFEVWTHLLKKLLIRKVGTTPEGFRMLAEIAESPQMPRGARFEAMFAISIAHLRAPAAPAPSDLQRTLLTGWQKTQPDPALAEGAKMLARFLDLDAAARKKLAGEIVRTEASEP